jgi:hypothetical protein
VAEFICSFVRLFFSRKKTQVAARNRLCAEPSGKLWRDV